MADVKDTQATEGDAAEGDKVVTLVVDHAPFCRGDVLNVTQLNKQGYGLELKKNEYLTGEVAFNDLPAVEKEDDEE